MNLLITIDENYLLPCETMLHSLFTSNPNEDAVSIYLLHSGIGDDKLGELSNFCALHSAKLHPILVEAELFSDAPVSKRYPKEMYYRLLAPLILPDDINRILYLDPDMLIINPLRPLWEANLYGRTFAAASHTGLTDMANGINSVRLNTENPYFNTGVLLIDLVKARKLVSSSDVFQCVKENEKDLILPDQDVFNMLYGAKTLAVEDVLWNYDVRNYSKYVIRSTGKHNINWVMENTAVLHFCGKNKPWKDTYQNPFGMIYRHYLNLTLRRIHENG